MTAAPLAITTSDRVDEPLRQRAQAAAAEHGLPYVHRERKSSLRAHLGKVAEALIVFESDAVLLVDALGTLRFSPGMGQLRAKRYELGEHDDVLIRLASLRPGDSVLDGTLGLAADAWLAARVVGPSGRVVGVEKSLALYLLARHGLELTPRSPQACPIAVTHADVHEHLRGAQSKSVDCVLLDPMFERKRKASDAFEVLRRYAEHTGVTPEVVAEAKRVARRVVLLKGSRYSTDFKKLGLRPEPAPRSATVLWARIVTD